MSNLVDMARKGRRYSADRAWTNEELEALVVLEKERGVPRPDAAEWVRNGVVKGVSDEKGNVSVDLSEYDKAKKDGFSPVKLEDAIAKAQEDLKHSLENHKHVAKEKMEKVKEEKPKKKK